MDRLKTTSFSALLLAILVAPAAFAQATAARLDIISGNGQLVCPNCSGSPINFYPLVVKVSDAAGKPIAGKTVAWTVASSSAPAPSVSDVAFTNNDGIAIATFFQAGGPPGTIAIPAIQSTVTATVDNLSATFYETQALVDQNGARQVLVDPDGPLQGEIYSGPAGSTSTKPIRIFVRGTGNVGIPNVSVHILKPTDSTVASASCPTGPGADPGSVLTDATGYATCYPTFGSVAGKAPAKVQVGGVDPAQFDQSISPNPVPPGGVEYSGYNGVQLDVSPVSPGRITKVSGDNQSINPGQSSAPLVAVVQDATGAVNIANISVQWTVSPAGAATLNPVVSTTNSQGQAQTTVSLSPNAVGQITVKAALTGANSGISTTFTLSTNVQLSSMTKVSGDAQTAPANQNFPNPLTVQLTGTNGQPVVNQPVSFVVSSGSATLSSSSANTDGNGRASVTVKAGATAGTVTVSAAVGNISQTFTLTVIPPGPTLSTGSFYNPGGLNKISALAPCGLVTVVATGLAPNIQNLVLNSNSFGPWSGTLASDSVSVNNTFAPIASVGVVNGLEQVTFQVPCDVPVSSSVPITISVGGGTGTVNMPVQLANPGILETLMTDGARRAVVVRPDGSFVSLQNPARRGEVVRVFVTGLGATIPLVGTGSLPVPGTDALVAGQVIVGVNNAGVRVVTSRLAPNLIGVAEVAFQVPSDAPAGNDVVLSVAVNAPSDSQTRFSNGSKLPIQ